MKSFFIELNGNGRITVCKRIWRKFQYRYRRYRPLFVFKTLHLNQSIAQFHINSLSVTVYVQIPDLGLSTGPSSIPVP
jgi:hypothetical protein